VSARPLLFAARHCLLRAALPTLVAVLVAGIGAALRSEAAAGGAGALSPWLQIAPFVAAVACCLAAIEYWPTLARGRPGADFVVRCTARPLHGAGTAAAGALLALLLLLLLLAAGAACLLPAPHAHRALTATGRPLLDSGDRELAFAAGGVVGDEVRLRAVALLPQQSPLPTELQVLADGQPLLAEPVEVAASHQLVRVPLGGRAVDTLTVRRTAGNLPLLFERDGVVVVESAVRSRLCSALLAFALYLVPAAVALAWTMLLGPLVALPVALAVTTAALALLVLADLSPAGTGVALAARGQWLPNEPVFRACVPSLGTGLAAMIGAMWLRRADRR